MTWTATLLNAVDRDTHWKIVVEFTDGTDTKKEGYRFTGTTAKQLKDFVRGKAAAFERNDASLDLVPLIGQSVDVTPPEPEDPVPPTQAQLDEQAWLDDFRAAERLERAFRVSPSLNTGARATALSNLQTSLAAPTNAKINSYLEKI